MNNLETLIDNHLKGLASPSELEALYQQPEAWREGLKRRALELQGLIFRTKQDAAEDEKKYQDDQALLLVVQDAWEKRVKKLEHKLFNVEKAMLMVNTQMKSKEVTEANAEARATFLAAAIRAHRDARGASSDQVDLKLYSALDGEWAFGHLHQDHLFEIVYSRRK